MKLNLLDQIGNWNPQLFREIKGRLKIGNMAIASALSLSGQLLLFMYYSAQIAVPSEKDTYPSHRFCLETTNSSTGVQDCVKDALGNFAIDWQQWWRQIFCLLSILSVLALLVAGTYSRFHVCVVH